MIDKSMKIKSLVWLWTLCTGWIRKWFSMVLRFRWRLRYIWVKTLKIYLRKIESRRGCYILPWPGFVTNLSHFSSYFVLWDIDECSEAHAVKMNKCHPNASCTNTWGSYNCSCIPGYTGDGFQCKGTFGVCHTITLVMVTIGYTYCCLVICKLR